MSWSRLQGDVVDVCKRLEDGPKFHAVLCDPPYDLGFMGKSWDTNAQFKEWGQAILPILYPGALVLMFGGTRKWHRLAVGMEDAGFEIWDTMMWLYGQGFPKAQDISKLIDKQNGDERTEVIGRVRFADGTTARKTQVLGGNGIYGGSEPGGGAYLTSPATPSSAPWSGHKTTALKPAWEPVLCFKKPLDGTYAESALEYGSGALNVDGGRIGGVKPDTVRGAGGQHGRYSELGAQGVIADDGKGRYPANLLLDEESAAMLDEQSGALTSGANPTRRFSDKTRGVYGAFEGHECIASRGQDSGGASRFFYCAKASSRERNKGLDGFELRASGLHDDDGYREPGERKANHTAPKPRANHHPTVKPIDLCRYLATLLLPPDSVKPRRIFVPFCGSGSEMIGCLQAGWDEVIGCDKEAQYGPIAEARVIGDAPLFNTSTQESNGGLGTP